MSSEAFFVQEKHSAMAKGRITARIGQSIGMAIKSTREKGIGTNESESSEMVAVFI